MFKKALILSLSSISILSGCVAYPPYPGYGSSYQPNPNAQIMLPPSNPSVSNVNNTPPSNPYEYEQIRRISSDATAASSFAQVALLESFTYDYKNYQSKMDKNYVYFTQDMWENLVTSFQANEEKNLVKNHASVSIIFKKSIQINQFGRELNTPNPRYIWWNMSVPVDLVMQKANGETYINHATIFLTVISSKMKDYRISQLSLHQTDFN